MKEKKIMEGILLDYHLIFIVLAVMLFVIEVLLVAVDPDRNKAIAAIVLAGFNLNICWFLALSSTAVNVYGFDYEGTLINNPVPDVRVLMALFYGLWMVNVGIMIYASRFFVQHSLSKSFESEPKSAFQGSQPRHRIRP